LREGASQVVTGRVASANQPAAVVSDADFFAGVPKLSAFLIIAKGMPLKSQGESSEFMSAFLCDLATLRDHPLLAR
jgi:hypothetical protein